MILLTLLIAAKPAITVTTVLVTVGVIIITPDL